MVRHQSLPEKTPRKTYQSTHRRRAHNREQLLVWLTHYNNRFGSSGSEGLINLQALPKPGPSWGPLDYGENVDRLEDANQYETDQTLLGVIGKLQKKKWPLYMALKMPYLDADSSPSVVEKWRVGAESGGVGEKIQFGLHEEAIDWILKELPEDFVLVVSPKLQVATGDLNAQRQRRRQRARLKFFDYEMQMGTEKAVLRVAKEEGFSRKEVYRLIKEAGEKRRKEKEKKS